MVSEATVKLHAKGERIVATGEGNGPVNALDKALRLALERLYPELAMLELADYKVRILEGSHGTGAVTRVLIESGDGTGAADGTGAPSGWTRTSSPPPGTPSRKRSPTPCSGPAISPSASEVSDRASRSPGEPAQVRPRSPATHAVAGS